MALQGGVGGQRHPALGCLAATVRSNRGPKQQRQRIAVRTYSVSRRSASSWAEAQADEAPNSLRSERRPCRPNHRTLRAGVARRRIVQRNRLRRRHLASTDRPRPVEATQSSSSRLQDNVLALVGGILLCAQHGNVEEIEQRVSRFVQNDMDKGADHRVDRRDGGGRRSLRRAASRACDQTRSRTCGLPSYQAFSEPCSPASNQEHGAAADRTEQGLQLRPELTIPISASNTGDGPASRPANKMFDVAASTYGWPSEARGHRRHGTRHPGDRLRR